MLDAIVRPSILCRSSEVTNIANSGCSRECCIRFYNNCNNFNCGRSIVSATAIQLPAVNRPRSMLVARCFHLDSPLFYSHS